jgi:hypothetical protein
VKALFLVPLLALSASGAEPNLHDLIDKAN